MKSSNTQTIIKEIARENGLTEREMYDIVNAPFDFLALTMKNADRENLDFPTVRIKYFATFFCSDERKNYYKRLKERRENAAKRREIYGTRATIIPVFTGDD